MGAPPPDNISLALPQCGLGALAPPPLPAVRPAAGRRATAAFPAGCARRLPAPLVAGPPGRALLL